MDRPTFLYSRSLNKRPTESHKTDELSKTAFVYMLLCLIPAKSYGNMDSDLFFPTLAAVLQGMNPAEDFFDMTDAFLEIPAL